MAFVTNLMKAPATLLLTLALVSSACVVGCSQADNGDGDSGEPETTEPEGSSGGSDGGSGDGADDTEE